MRIKGITLPVNSVIVIALAVMVLLMLAAFFAGGASQIDKATLENAWTKCCSTIQGMYNCNQSANLSNINPGIDINANGTTENCEQICKAKFGVMAEPKDCVCACPGCCT